MKWTATPATPIPALKAESRSAHFPPLRGGEEPQRDQGSPERVRPAATELRLEDQPDPGAGLEGVVGEEPEGRAGGERTSQSHLGTA